MAVSGEHLPYAECNERQRGEGRNEKAGRPMARDALEHVVPPFVSPSFVDVVPTRWERVAAAPLGTALGAASFRRCSRQAVPGIA
jgi:hypothetical protein